MTTTLKWLEIGAGYFAETPIGTYDIGENNTDGVIEWVMSAPVFDYYDECNSESGAKAAAQKHYDEIVAQIIALSTSATDPQGLAHIVDYTNWRGETARRVIRPIRMWWGKTEWHPEEQWMLTAWDCEKDAIRDFAWQDMRPVQNPATSAALAACHAPQPAADTRVVDQEWLPIETAPRDGTWFRAKTMGSPGFEQIRLVHFADKYDRLPINGEDVIWTRLPTHWQPLSASAIIGNATPAPSDKIAEAARERMARALREYQMQGRITVDWDKVPKSQRKKWFDLADVSLRALAGQGE